MSELIPFLIVLAAGAAIGGLLALFSWLDKRSSRAADAQFGNATADDVTGFIEKMREVRLREAMLSLLAERQTAAGPRHRSDDRPGWAVPTPRRPLLVAPTPTRRRELVNA